jgi:hypothetical protein
VQRNNLVNIAGVISNDKAGGRATKFSPCSVRNLPTTSETGRWQMEVKNIFMWMNKKEKLVTQGDPFNLKIKTQS